MPNDFGILGVESERKEHPAIKSGKEELGDTPGSIGFAKVDGQRLYKGPGTGGMGTTPRLKNTGGAAVNKTSPGSFKVRKRTLKG